MDKLFSSIQLIHEGKYRPAVDNVSGPAEFVITAITSELTGNFEESLVLASSLKRFDGDWSVWGLILQSYCHWRLGNYIKGLENVEIAIDLIDEDTHPYLLGKAHNIAGLIHWKKNVNLDLSEAHFTKALKIRQSIDNPIDIAYSLNNFGNLRLKQKQIDVAKMYFDDAFEIRKKLGLIPGLAGSHNSLGRYFEQEGDFKSALNHYTLSLDYWVSIKNTQFEAKQYRFLSSVFSKMDLKEDALRCIELALKLFSKIPNRTDLGISIALKQKLL